MPTGSGDSPYFKPWMFKQLDEICRTPTEDLYQRMDISPDTDASSLESLFTDLLPADGDERANMVEHLRTDVFTEGAGIWPGLGAEQSVPIIVEAARQAAAASQRQGQAPVRWYQHANGPDGEMQAHVLEEPDLVTVIVTTPAFPIMDPMRGTPEKSGSPTLSTGTAADRPLDGPPDGFSASYFLT